MYLKISIVSTWLSKDLKITQHIVMKDRLRQKNKQKYKKCDKKAQSKKPKIGIGAPPRSFQETNTKHCS